jgi:hypothetical protein
MPHEYVMQHFECLPVPVLSPFARAGFGLVRGPLGRRRFNVVASGVDVMARRAASPPLVTRRHRLSVVIPVFNERRTFAVVMEQLLQKEIPGVDLELIVGQRDFSPETNDSVRAECAETAPLRLPRGRISSIVRDRDVLLIRLIRSTRLEPIPPRSRTRMEEDMRRFTRLNVPGAVNPENAAYLASITQTQDALLGELAGRTFTVTARFRTVPLLGLQASPGALDVLASSSHVVCVAEDALSAPMGRPGAN